MDKQIKLLHLIADGEFHSGEDLGAALSVTRAAIWKTVKSLQNYGLNICSVRGKGYRLPAAIEFLDHKRILALIDPDVTHLVGPLEIHESIESSNQYLLDRQATSSIHGYLILSEFQTSGRGRQGRVWISPFGAGISLSLGWHFDCPVESLTHLSLATGVAIIRSLHKFDIKKIGLKWPNDILWHGRKLGGILIEMKGESAGPCDVVVGVGLNVMFPKPFIDKIDQPWVDVASIKHPCPSRNELTAALISEIVLLLDRYQAQDTRALIDEWRRYDCVHGKMATLSTPNQSVFGRVMGVDNNGALLLSVRNEIRKYTSGEISMRIQP